MLGKCRRPVAFFVNGIGDAILALPALRALSSLFADRLTLITDVVTSELCSAELPLADEIIIEMLPAEGPPSFDVEPILKRVNDCDLFISLVPWHSSSMDNLISQLRPFRTIGYFEAYDHPLPLDFSKHSAELIFDAPKFLEPSLVFTDFVKPPQAFYTAAQLPQAVRSAISPRCKILAVHNETVPEKIWSNSHLAVVLNRFLAAHRDFYAFVVGVKPYVVDRVHPQHRVIPCFGLSLVDSCRIVSSADIFLGVDSCMLHVADFSMVPGVGLFGTTDAHEFGFRLAPHRHLTAEGMDAIKPEEVYTALDSLVKGVKGNVFRANGLGCCP